MNKKFLKMFAIFIFGVIVFIPNVIAENYFNVGDFRLNDELYNNVYSSYSWYNGKNIIEHRVNNKGKFSFTLTANELDETKQYDVVLKSDYLDEIKTYSGNELMNGVEIIIDDAKSTVDVIVKEKNTDNYVDYKHVVNCNVNDSWCKPVSYYEQIAFYFDDTQDLTEVIDKYNSLNNDGKVKINSLKLDNKWLESSISAALSQYSSDKYLIIGYCQDENCYLNITDKNNIRHYKQFNVEYEFAQEDKDVKEKIDEYAKKFNFTNENIEDNLFSLVDLENLNYKFATLNNDDYDIDKINSIINYSSEIHKYFNNDNLSLYLDVRAGWDEDFTSGGFGFLNMLYKNVVYDVVEPVGIKQINVIYVPDGTKKTREAYIKAAKKRIEEYLKNVKVDITYGGQISDIDTSNWIIPLDKIVDETKTIGEYYNVKLNDKIFKFFIEEGSDKMNVPFMNTRDLNTNIYVTSDSFEAPLDSKISVNILDKNSDEYKELLKKLKLTDGEAIDLKLFSNTLNAYVTKLSNGNFKVYIPLDNDNINKDFIAYYYKEDGSIEQHNVKVENGYATFETDHFSTYVLSPLDNPKTNDNIIIYFITFLISIVVLISNVYYLKIKRNR